LPNDLRTSRICTDDIGLLSPQFMFSGAYTEGDATLSFSTLTPGRISTGVIISSFRVFSNPMVALSIIVQTSNSL
jgi:hypothetical protein